MHDWQHNFKTDFGLRLCGLTLCGVSYLSIRTLGALRLSDGQVPQPALLLLIAAISFLCASAGSALLFLGRHIFDHVEISQRWWKILPLEYNPQPDTVVAFTAMPRLFAIPPPPELSARDYNAAA